MHLKSQMSVNTILCVKWGEKYSNDYVLNLKNQCEKHCSIPFNFYCLTDNPQNSFDLKLPTTWDKHYDSETKRFWAYRKMYMFNENLFPTMNGDMFLYLDLDVLIQQDLKYFFELRMNKPYIVKGWWNDIDNCRKNYGAIKSTPLNSSVLRWNKSQMQGVYSHIEKNQEVIFFTYSTIDNYFNHHWYNVWDEKVSYMNVYPKGDIYSWYKGNIFPEDMETKKIRKDQKVCLFNNSTVETYEDMFEIEELKKLW